jgi:hypothetical protein
VGKMSEKPRNLDHTNPKGKEFGEDQVGRPEEEKEQAHENFDAFPQGDKGGNVKFKEVVVGKEPEFEGDTPKEKSNNYWRKVRHGNKSRD